VGDSITISRDDSTNGDVYDLADALSDGNAVTSANLLELPCWDNDAVSTYQDYNNGIHIFYSDYIKDFYGTCIYSNNEAKSGITAAGTHTKFIDNVNGYADRFTSLDGNGSNADLFGPTHAYVMLGLNDKRLFVSEADYEANLTKVVHEIHNQSIAYENITLLYPTYSINYDVLDYLDNIDNVANNLGTKLITELYNETKANYDEYGVTEASWYELDDVHFTRDGSKNISRIIAENTIFTAELTCTCGDICVNENGWWRDGGVLNGNGTPIQAAVDDATAGETVYVWNGSYTENVNVDKRLTLTGEGAYVVNVTADSASDHVFEVTANYVNITGFTLENATASGKAGICLGDGVNSCNITNNTVKLNYNGIYLGNADDNNITCNWVHHNTRAGFNLTGGSIGNNISHNNIVENGGFNGSSGGWEWQFYNNQNNITDATNNWWGSGMTNETVNASIYDWTYDNTTGNVTVLPMLNSAAPCAPIPELSTVILLGVGLLMLAGYLRMRRKR
jgi:parallel beta-helix repeat protein